MTLITEQLASYLTDFAYQDMSKQVVNTAKHCVLDSVGCMMGGAQMPSSQALLQLLQRWGGNDQALVVGTELRLSTPWATYANAYLANVLDFDDTYVGMGHPGATIVPTAITMADALGVPGPSLLAAIVAGYEVSLRVGRALRSPTSIEKVVGHATWGIFGAVAVVGKLLGLGHHQMTQALALAAVNAPVPAVRKSGRKERPYTWIKNNYGWAALGGLMAAQMAAEGFRGNLTILDGDTGFLRMVGSDCCRWEVFTEGLGERYMIQEISFKPYPACRRTHSTIYAIECIMSDHHIDPCTIRRITVDTDQDVVRDFMVYDPVDIIDAQFSLPYVVAMAALGYAPGLDWARPENLGNPRVQDMMRKVRARDVFGFKRRAESGWQVRVAIETHDGKTFEDSIPRPPGDPSLPLPYEQLAAKFKGLCKPSLGKRVGDALRTIEKLEAEHDSDWISRVLGKSSRIEGG